jgi:hypothetical protein
LQWGRIEVGDYTLNKYKFDFLSGETMNGNSNSDSCGNDGWYRWRAQANLSCAGCAPIGNGSDMKGCFLGPSRIVLKFDGELEAT